MLKPYKHQQEIIDKFKNHDGCGLFLEPGCGKSLIAIHLARHKYNEHKEILKTLVLTPPITLNNWVREFELNSKIDSDHIATVSGAKDKRLKTLQSNKRIFIMNYEALRTGEILDKIKAFAPKVIICDESHIIKSPTSKVYKATYEVSKGAWYKYILTGTPLSQGALDAWSQYMVMDGGKTFGERFYSFKNRYYENKTWPGATFPNWQPIPSMQNEFKEKLARTSVKIAARDCLDLPDLVEDTIHVEPSPEAKRHYKELKDDLITWFDDQADDPLVAKNALTKALRLQEILSGYMKLESGEVKEFKSNPKLDALMSLIDSTNPHKVIVFCIFRHDYAVISQALKKKKINYVEIHGGVSGVQKLENVDTFNDQKNNCRVAIVNPKSGGVGINLRSAKYAIFYSTSYSLIDFEQSIARNYRAGSVDFHDKIVRYYLCHKGLADEKAFAALRDKKQVADNLLDIRSLI